MDALEVFERIQTLLGRTVYADELPIIAAAVFRKDVQFLLSKESTEPFTLSQSRCLPVRNEDMELMDKLCVKADEMGLTSDELASRIITSYCREVAADA